MVLSNLVSSNARTWLYAGITSFKARIGLTFLFLLLALPAFAAGGTCPSGVNYLVQTSNTPQTLSAIGVTSCYFIANSGSDTNSGTSESSPWLHAPGMPGCASTCSGTNPVAGEGFIFRGGDTWHYSAGTPIGMPWNWTASGSSSNPIYIGVDPTWSSGSSWERPVLTMDNPVTTSFPSSCTYDDTNYTGVTLNSVNHVIFDNFEFTGKCWAGSPFAGTLRPLGTYITMSNLYFHGWSVVKGSVDTHYMILGGNPGAVTHNVIVANVFDGSDSSHGAGGSAGCTPVANSGSPCASGFAVYFDAYDVHNSVFRYLSNGVVGTSMYTMHDNLFEYMWNSYDDTTHPNVIESVGGISGSNLYFYNNIIRYTHQNVLYWPQWAATAYMFNNILFENDNGSAGTGGNCFMLSPTSNGNTPAVYIYNNTFAGDDGVCQFNFFPGNSSTPSWTGTAFFENNHFIASGTSLFQPN